MMTRRTFVRSSSALACAAASPRAAAADPVRVLDAHVHFYDPTRPQGVPWPNSNQPALYQPTYPERYLSNIPPVRTDGVVAVEASPWLEDNLWLLQVADRSRLVWAVVGNIPPGRAEFKNELGRFSKHPLFRGIRIGSAAVATILAQPEALADLKLLAGKDLSLDILLDTPRRFPEIAHLARAVPELRLVLGHLPLDPPRDEPGRSAYRTDLKALGQLPSIYAKVSGVVRRIEGKVPTDAAFYKPALDELWDTFGADRVLYASNWPASDTTAPYPVVFRVVKDYLSGQSPRTIEKYFWRNAAAVYKCHDR